MRKIRQLQIRDATDVSLSAKVDAVNYVTTHYGVNNNGIAISTSWSVIQSDFEALHSAIVSAYTEGCVIVSSTGNDHGDFDYSYPAKYDEVIGVGATTGNDLRAGYSNYGALVGIDIAAPVGANDLNAVKSTGAGSNGYLQWVGTSFAAPQVAAVAGLMLSINSSLPPYDIRSIIINTAEKVGGYNYNIDPNQPGWSAELGYGRINAYQALLLTHAYSNKSMSSGATAANNGRRLVKTSDGKYHLVFESGITAGGNVLSEIFYRNYDGINWNTPIRLSAGNEQNRYSSIAERIDGTNKKLYVVWQRKTSTNTYDILFRHFNGSSWDAIQTVTSGISVTSDPLPVIAISTPSASFEMMVAYRNGNGLKSKRSTSANGSSWESEIIVTSSTSAGTPSLTYSSNDFANFDITWDNGSAVYYRHFYGSNWSNEIIVSSGSSANTHQYSSYGRGSTNNRHIVWQATDPSQGNRKVILHNLNLNTTVYTKFYSSSVNYLRPNISGFESGGAALLWHDDASAKNIRNARWEHYVFFTDGFEIFF